MTERLYYTIIKPCIPWLVIIYTLVLPSLLLAQDEFYTNYTVNDGLSSNFIYSIEQDTNGVMWLATDNGLCSFDGDEFECYSSELGIDNLEFFELFFDLKGRLWISCQHPHPIYYSNGRLHEVLHLKNSSEIRFFEASEFNKNEIVIRNGMFLFNLDLTSLIVKSIDTLKTLNESRRQNYNDKSDFSQALFEFYVTHRKQGRQFGLIDLNKNQNDNSKGKPFLGHLDSLFNELGDIKIGKYIEANHTFWARTYNGLLRVPLQSPNAKPELLLKGKDVYSIFRDREQNLWIGTKNNGLFIYSPNLISMAHTTTSNPIFSNLETLERVIEIDNEMYVVKNRNELYQTKFTDKLDVTLIKKAESPIYDFHVWNDKPLISTAHIVTEYSKQSNAWKTIFRGYKSEIIKKICPINENLVFLFSTRIHELNDEYHVKSTAFSPPARVSAHCLLNDSILIFGTTLGLYHLNPHAYDSQSITLIHSKSVNHIEKKNKQSFWTSTSRSTIFEYHQDNNEINIVDSFSIESDYIRDVHYFENRLFLALNSGIAILNSDSLALEKFTPSSNNVTINSIAHQRNNLFVASSSTIQVVDVEQMNNDSPTDVLIQKFVVNDKEQNLSGPQKFNYQNNNVTIHYAYPRYTYSNPEIYYRLHPSQNNFTKSSIFTSNFIDVQPGHHTFEVFAQTKSGLRSKISSISFTINPPWWRTWWFYTLCCILFGSIIYYLFQQSRKKQRAQLSLLQQRINTLHAQMNPHFLFNALQSLQYYINTDNKKGASKYLVSFSKLLRKTLETSANDYISIANEIEYLTSYLQLEQDKFDHQLVFEIDLSSTIDFEVKIPSMVVQPFVENALIHGFVNTDQLNRILIKFQLLADDTIQCQIIDNGQGIDHAAPVKSRHDSFATKAIEKKLNLLSQLHRQKNYKRKVDILITNNKQLKSSIFEKGTTVTIELPIIHNYP